jgi:hypothetical protein
VLEYVGVIRPRAEVEALVIWMRLVFEADPLPFKPATYMLDPFQPMAIGFEPMNSAFAALLVLFRLYRDNSNREI